MPRAQKAAIYCRVSTLHQVDRDSLPMQRQDMINYAKYVLGIEEYEVFEDAGYSGKNTDRPAFQAMMERIESGEFSHVLVWKIDRISRNLLDFATMYARCKKLGVTFVQQERAVRYVHGDGRGHAQDHPRLCRAGAQYDERARYGNDDCARHG